MRTIKEILVSSLLVLSLGAISNLTIAAQTGMTQPINNTIAHLDAALSAVNADDLEVAQEHINAARQSSKEIIGGTLAPKASRGSDAIVKARRHVKKGDKDAAAALNEALEIFHSMLRSSDGGSQGGLQ